LDIIKCFYFSRPALLPGDGEQGPDSLAHPLSPPVAVLILSSLPTVAAYKGQGVLRKSKNRGKGKKDKARVEKSLKFCFLIRRRGNP